MSLVKSPLSNSGRYDRGLIDQSLNVIVLDDRDGFEMVSHLLVGYGQFSLHWAADGDRLMEMLAQGVFDCVIVESVSGGESGFAINETIRMRYPIAPPVIFVTNLGGEKTAVQAFRSGFSDYFNKNRISGHSLKVAILRAVDAKYLEQNRLDQIAKLSTLAMQDPITGLSNRSYLDNRLVITLESAGRNHNPFAIILIDIDRFGFLNDNYGRAIGDRVLCRFSEKLKQVARRSDTFGRFGADEFLYLIDRDVSPESVSLAGRRLADGLCFAAEFENIGIRLSASIGASIYPDDGIDVEELTKAAAMAALEAKTSGTGFRLASTQPVCRQEGQANGAALLSAPLQSNETRILAPASVPHVAVPFGVAPQPDSTSPRYEAAVESNLAVLPEGLASDTIESPADRRGPALVSREDNRRIQPRQRVLKRGLIETKDRMSTFDCTIRDLSEGGAKIAMPGAFVLSEQFYLQIVGSKSRLLAERRWQDGTHIGLKFLNEERAR